MTDSFHSSSLEMQDKYDYVFLGAGCASLSLIMRMIRSGKFHDKRILLIDKEPKTINDRTWCFWEKKIGFFDAIVYKKWNSLSFLSNEYSNNMDISPYQYKMIRGIDFYNYCFEEIKKQDNIEIVYGTINSWKYEREGINIVIDNKNYYFLNTEIFNSIYKPGATNTKTIRLLQHFKGWMIETDTPAFDPNTATMMDFRVHQQHGPAFTYLLPISTTSALVEYTLLTKKILPPEVYDNELKNYISTFLGLSNYVIKEKEFGVIPMTNEPLRFSGQGWQIGTAGGQTKASSGYTFQFIQKQSQQITDHLIAEKNLNNLPLSPGRFRFYDNVLLHILYHNSFPADKIFAKLFKKNKPQQVLRFLDNETSFNEELAIISSLPAIPFLKAAFKQL